MHRFSVNFLAGFLFWLLEQLVEIINNLKRQAVDLRRNQCVLQVFPIKCVHPVVRVVDGVFPVKQHLASRSKIPAEGQVDVKGIVIDIMAGIIIRRQQTAVFGQFIVAVVVGFGPVVAQLGMKRKFVSIIIFISSKIFTKICFKEILYIGAIKF